jgi:hypothetical protein
MALHIRQCDTIVRAGEPRCRPWMPAMQIVFQSPTNNARAKSIRFGMTIECGLW